MKKTQMLKIKPKILQVFKTASPISFGGVEDVINNVASTTNKYFEHTVLCTNKDKSFVSIEKNYKLVSFKYSLSFSNNPISLEFHKFLLHNSKNYDIIHFHFPYPMMDFHYYVNVPYIVTYHADLLRSRLITTPYRLLAKPFLSRAARVVYTSNKYLHYSKFSKYGTKLSVIPLTASVLSESFLNQNFPKKNYFIFIGAFRKYKDLLTLLNAAISSDVELIILGEGSNSNALRRFVKERKSSKIKFLGQVSDEYKFKLLSEARALVLPSNNESEAFGVVLLEAATLGKPIITANLQSGVTEVNEDGLNGIIFEKSNPISLKKALLKLATDDKLCDRLGHANGNKYIKNYTRALFGKRYKSIYFDTMKSSYKYSKLYK